jgi:hypothetical protein
VASVNVLVTEEIKKYNIYCHILYSAKSPVMTVSDQRPLFFVVVVY